jgi:hypothetical protein
VVEDTDAAQAGAASSRKQANSAAGTYPYHVPVKGFVLLERGGSAGSRRSVEADSFCSNVKGGNGCRRAERSHAPLASLRRCVASASITVLRDRTVSLCRQSHVGAGSSSSADERDTGETYTRVTGLKEPDGAARLVAGRRAAFLFLDEIHRSRNVRPGKI